MSYEVVGTFSEVNALRKMNAFEVVESRPFRRWYQKHKRKVDACAGLAVFVLMQGLKVSPYFLSGILLPQVALPVAAGSLFSGDGVILLHMLIIGFVTLVVSTFLKFTGRGDLIPLVMFVGGAVILKECLGLFHSIYRDVHTFLNL